MIKQKRKEKAGKWAVPIPKVKAMSEEEMFKIMRSGKRRSTFFYLEYSFSIIQHPLYREGLETCCQ